MDLFKWEKLYIRDDRLRPVGLRTGNSEFSDPRWEHTDIGDMHGDGDCPVGIASDLIHARANTYLAETDREPCLCANGFSGNDYSVSIWCRDDDQRLTFYADSPVDAYYFACCYWLGVEP
jgi:hypothetical protein